MMEYSIGSVADLISGSTTPNKPKVIKKQFKMKTKKTPLKKTKIEDIQSKNIQRRVNRKRKNVHLKEHIPKEEIDENEETPVKISKKKPFRSPKIKHESSDEVSDATESDASDEELINNAKEVDENEEAPLKISKMKRIRSQKKIEHENSDEVPDETESDASDDEEIITTSKKRKQKPVTEITPKNPDHVTVFVGNLPVLTTHKKLEKMFSKFGNVVSARIRSIPVADPKIPKKVAAITKQFHLNRKSVNGYVTFATRADAKNSLSLNGQEYKDHHIRVNICDEQSNPDKTKAVFLGNVSFEAEEEELWKLFESCGEIESVRLVRDRRTDIGKGFGYINFKSADSVELALQMGEVTLRDRILRISLYNCRVPKKAKPHKNNQKPNDQKKMPLVTTATNGEFQGKFAIEKKKKFNKENQQRKKLAGKIAPKTMSI